MSDSAKVRLVLGIIAAVIVSFVLSVREPRYAIWGETTTARVIKAEEQEQHRRRRVKAVWYLRYEFDDHGTKRIEATDMPQEWRPPADRKLAVQYIPGSEGVSRVEGQGSLGPVYFLIGSVIVGAGCIFVLGRKYNV